MARSRWYQSECYPWFLSTGNTSIKGRCSICFPFVGRLDDQSVNGIALINQIASIYRMHGSQTQILSASIRSVQHVSDSFLSGANICTMPPSIFEKMYNHILTDKGLELFDRDWHLYNQMIEEETRPWGWFKVLVRGEDYCVNKFISSRKNKSSVSSL